MGKKIGCGVVMLEGPDFGLAPEHGAFSLFAGKKMSSGEKGSAETLCDGVAGRVSALFAALL